MAEFASNGKANAGLTTGIIGTALGVLGGGLNFLGGNNGMMNNSQVDNLKEMYGLSSELAQIKAERYSDNNTLELYKHIDKEIREVRDTINTNAAAQAVINATTNASVSVLGSQVSDINNTLANLTKVVIPNSSVCPGWGNATVSITTTDTTA